MAGEFHPRHGSLIFLSNENHSARRRNAATEFNNALIFSKCALKDSEIYEVRIDRKINNWSGSLAIGVMTSDPNSLEIPSSASGLKNGSWIMSGVSILKDGALYKDDYGKDLDELKEGDRIGVQRQSNGTLHFFVNGLDQGVAATLIPSTVFAVIDLYGKCVEISLYKPFLQAVGTLGVRAETSTASVSFHPHCGSLVSLSNNNRTAERQRPNEEFKNAIVLSSTPLKNDELFEVQLEDSTEMWAGSLEVGVTGHDPETIVLPPTMTSMPTETWMLSGTSIIINGQETTKCYSEISLETIQIEDRVGIMRRNSGCLHFFINGEDQGVAVTNIPEKIYGVIDLYGGAVKVSLCGNTSSCSSISNELTNSEIQDVSLTETPERPLTFHPRCGMAVSLINENRTAFRPRAMEEFNNAVVLTNRFLKTNELFEVHIDKQVEKWAGSLEIGVTIHSPEGLELPSTMTNITTGTWMMSGGGIVNNGVTTIEEYGHSLEDLKVGDTVAALIKPDGSLHFFVNGQDLGLAAQDVPLSVYGVVDLYGQSAQVTLTCSQRNHPDSQCVIIEEQESSEACEPVVSTNQLHVDNFAVSENWFRFSDHHGEQVTVSRDCRSAIRINPLTEFNNAVVMSHRPLRDDELFEVIIEKVVDRWSGSLEAGVTKTSPEQLDFPGTMTDLGHDIWMLSGSSVLQDGNTVKNGYECDLDKLADGSRLGIMRKSDGTLHFFVNGEDCGAAAGSVPTGVYAMIDLYGQCVQISVYDEDYRGAQLIELPSEGASSTLQDEHQSLEVIPSGFHSCCGKNITFRNNKTAVVRTSAFNNGVTFSSKPLEDDEIFEIKLDKVTNHWSGSVAVGVTSATLPLLAVPPTAAEMKDGTWIVSGSCVLKDAVVVKENYGFCLDRLQAGTCIGVQRRKDGTFHVFINCIDQGVAATDVPRVVYAVVDIYGRTEAVSLMTHTGSITRSVEGELAQTTPKADQPSPCPQICFHGVSGQHIKLDSKCCTAQRVDGYNHGVVMSKVPLPNDQLFQVEIKRVNSRWSGSIKIGVTGQDPEDFSRMPSTANNMKSSSWIVLNNAVYVNGIKVSESLGRNLDILQAGDRVGILVDNNGCLHLVINGEDLGIVAEDVSSRRYAVVDLYGCCEEVTIVSDQLGHWRGSASMEGTKAALGLGEHAKGPCDYRQLCDRFRASLAIPDGYFNPDSKLNICYCQSCHEARGEKRYSVSGDPPCRYALPLGWCQFALRFPPRSDVGDVWESWHVAFYGCQAGWIRRTLDRGDLPVAASRTNIQPSTSCNSNKEHDRSSKLIISPTILCAACNSLVVRQSFQDMATGKQFSTQAAFQLRVRPGCYDTGQASCSVDRNALMDQNLGTENVEWYLKDRGVVMLTAVLIRVDPVNNS